ncbi:MAG: MerR family transcriptional regulator [Methylococcaceae bacterium]|nr:MerR family transcriptional regulator [Methylococcaceae bacterium]
MTNYLDNASCYLISTVVKRSGVKADLIRAWERRYKAVTPTRTDGGHRVYNDQDIARLKLLNQATSEGHSIGQIAQLSIDELQKLMKIEQQSAYFPATSNRAAVPDKANPDLAEAYIEKCYTAMMVFDARAIESHFENAVVELGAQAFMENLLTPLLARMGEDWKAGNLRPSHEHMTTSVIRSMVYILRSNYTPADNAPRLVISTPIGQQHELGALIAALIAEFKGWHITYLGPDLPAEEIAFAVKSSNANAVALSITLTTEDHIIPKEIRRLKKLIGREVALIVGGSAAEDYKAVLDEVGALRSDSCDEFKQMLDELTAQFQASASLKNLTKVTG